jgi:CDP-paratose synthetase
MKNILLTGATGFLGSYILRELINRNYNVVILKRSISDDWRIKDLMNKIISYDIDKIDIENPFKQQNIDIIIHTATNYGRNVSSIYGVVETNLMFPLKLLEIAVSYNTKVFINTDTLLKKDINHYSLSKKQLLEWFKYFSNNIKIINLKLEHIYGPKDDDSKFVSKIINQLLANVSNINLTKGEQKRDFIYIDDVVNVYTLVLENIYKFDSYTELDVGTGNQIELKYFIKKIYDTINNKIAIDTKLNFGAISYRIGEPMVIDEDIKPLYKLGWKPTYSIDSGISRTIDGILNE